MERISNSVIPDDLVEEILLRLTVKHLLRLRCVSRSWCALFDDYSFIKKHYRNQYELCKANGDIPLLLTKVADLSYNWNDPNRLHILSKQRGDVLYNLTPQLWRDSAPLFTNDPDLMHTVHCRGVVNGVIWLCLGPGNKERIGLWNPATKEFVILPQPDVPDGIDRMLGFGFDPASNDFKVVVSSRIGEREPVTQYLVYSLNTNSWKRIREPPVFVDEDLSSRDSSLNGVYYWAANEYDNDEHSCFRRSVILSFNFSTEVFKICDPPVGGNVSALYPYGDGFQWMIGFYKERLAVTVFRKEVGETTCCIDVWVVTKFDDDDNDFGAPLSWQCILNIGPIPTIKGCWVDLVDTFRMDGDLLLSIASESYTGEVCNIYNPTTRSFKSLEMIIGNCFTCVESLFPLSRRLVKIRVKV